MCMCIVSHFTDTRTHKIILTHAAYPQTHNALPTYFHTHTHAYSQIVWARVESHIIQTHVPTTYMCTRTHNVRRHSYVHGEYSTHIHACSHSSSSYVVDMYEQAQMVNSCTLILRQGDDACTICLCRTHTHTHTHQRIQIYTHTHTCTHTHMLTLTHPPIHAHIQHVRTVIA